MQPETAVTAPREESWDAVRRIEVEAPREPVAAERTEPELQVIEGPEQSAFPSMPAHTVRGQTRVRSSQRPAAGVSIRVSDMRDWASTAVSDELGCFEVAVPEQGFWFLEVGGGAWALDTFGVSFVVGAYRGSCGAILEVRPSACISGRVIGPGGAPIHNGYVAAYDDEARLFLGEPRQTGDVLARFLDERGDEHLYAMTARAPLDAEGRFRLEGVIAEEPVHLFVHSNDVLPDFHATLVLAPGEVREVLLGVPAVSRIRGRVELPTLPAKAEVVRRNVLFRSFGAQGSAEFQRAPLAEDGTFSSMPLWHTELYEVRLIIEVEVGDGPATKYWVHVFTTPLAEGQVLDLDLGDVEWKILLPGEVVDWRDYRQ